METPSSSAAQYNPKHPTIDPLVVTAPGAAAAAASAPVSAGDSVEHRLGSLSLAPSLQLRSMCGEENPDHKAIEAALQAGADKNDQAEDGETILMVAARSNCVTAKLLIKYGADVNAVDKNKMTALMYALDDDTYLSEEEQQELVQVLLTAGAKVNVFDKQRRTALYHAVEHEIVAAVSILLAHDAFVDPADDQGLTPLHKAAEYGQTKLAKDLIAAGASLDLMTHDGRSAFAIALLEGQSEIAKLLLDEGADPNTILQSQQQNTTALIFSIRSEDLGLEIVQSLLEHGCDINKSDWDDDTPLIVASRSGNYQIVRFLLSYGPDLDLENDDDETALIVAKDGGHEEIIKLLNQYKSDPETLKTISARPGLCSVAPASPALLSTTIAPGPTEVWITNYLNRLITDRYNVFSRASCVGNGPTVINPHSIVFRDDPALLSVHIDVRWLYPQPVSKNPNAKPYMSRAIHRVMAGSITPPSAGVRSAFDPRPGLNHFPGPDKSYYEYWLCTYFDPAVAVNDIVNYYHHILNGRAQQDVTFHISLRTPLTNEYWVFHYSV